MALTLSGVVVLDVNVTGENIMVKELHEELSFLRTQNYQNSYYTIP